MASWIGLAFLILLSANAVFGDTPYKDQEIENDEYLQNCIITSGMVDGVKNGVKEFHSGSECYARTVIKFKVEAGSGRSFIMQNRQDNGLVAPAKIKYKFGSCDDIVIEIDKGTNDAVKYNLRNPDDGSLISLDGELDFHLKRRAKNEFDKLDTMEVRVDGNSVFSKQCNAFEKDPQDDKVPTLLLFEQEVVSGVPDLTLLWNVYLSNKGYVGTAYATEIIDVGTTTSTTTTTVKPPPAPVARTSTKPSTKVSTSSPVPSTLSTTVGPTDVVVEESEEEAFPWWIIAVAVGVAVVLLIILLVVGYFCCRRRRAQKSQAQAEANVGASVKKVQEKSESAADKMYFERDAKPTDPKAVSKEAVSKEAASKKSTSKEIASK